MKTVKKMILKKVGVKTVKTRFLCHFFRNPYVIENFGTWNRVQWSKIH